MNFFFYQNESELPEDIINGNCYFVSNSSSSKGFDIYLDDEGSRKIFDESIVGLTYNQFMEAIKDLIFSTININAPSNISVSPTAYVLNEQQKETNSFPVRALGNYTGYIVYGNQGKSASSTVEITETGQTLSLSPKASQLTIESDMSGIFTLQSPSGQQVQTTEKSYVLWEGGSWTISINSQSQNFNVALGQNTTVTIEEEQEFESKVTITLGSAVTSHLSSVYLYDNNSHQTWNISDGSAKTLTYSAQGSHRYYIATSVDSSDSRTDTKQVTLQNGQTHQITFNPSILHIENVEGITITAKGPSGQTYTCDLLINSPYMIVEEIGNWTISASGKEDYALNVNAANSYYSITLKESSTPEPPSGEDYYIGFITDSHESIAGLSYLESHNPDIIIHGGDYIEYGAPSVLTSSVRAFGNHIACMGNHDYTVNSEYTEYVSDAQTSSCFSGTLMQNRTTKYYYYDIDRAKIRIIVLNTQDRNASNSSTDPQHNHNISSSQLSFLKSALQGKGPDWRAIIVSHAPLTPMNDRPGWYGGTAGSLMTSICSSTLAGYSVADAGDKMPVLLCLSGHCHALGYKYYNGICHLTGYSNNAGKNTYGGESGDSGTSGQKKSHWYLIKITSKNQVTVYDYVNNSIFKTIEIDGTESGGGQGNPDSDSTFSCIAFEDGKLQYLDTTRTTWNNNNRNGTLDQVLYPHCDKTTITLNSGQSTTYTFVNGLMQNGITRMLMTPPDEASATYAAYFNSSGEYIGYSNASSQSKTNNPTSSWWDDNGTGNGDFFGVPEQKLSDALGS